MAGIFKSLDQSDIRITPFRTYKLWADHLNYCDYTYQLDSNSLSIPRQISTLTSNPRYIYTVDLTNYDIAKLDTNDKYAVLDTLSFAGSLSIVRTALDINHEYLICFSASPTTYVVDQDLNVVDSANVNYATTILDASADVANNDLYYCGVGGVGRYDLIAGVLSAEADLSAPPFTENYTHINMEGTDVCTSGVAIHSGSSGTHFVDLPYLGNDQILPNNSPCKRLVYGESSYYYALFESGELYRYDPVSGGLVLVMTNIADILEDKNTFAATTTVVDSTRQLHVIGNEGQVYPDFHTTVAGGAAYAEPIDTRRWISLGRTLQASINKNTTGRIGIVGQDTGSLIDTVFYTVDPYSGEISDPKHFGAINGMSVEGENLTTFIGVDPVVGKVVDLDCEYTPVYSTYKADYDPISNHARANPLEVLFDQGNRHYEYTEPLTSNGKYQRVVHRSLDNLFYSKFYTNTRATFGTGNINTQYRFLEDQAQVISLPQSKFGESLLPESIKIDVAYYDSQGTQNLTLVDDVYGNLNISGAYYSCYGNLISGSVDAVPVGAWPFDELYRYYQKGLVNVTSSFNRGTWNMQAAYSNVEFVKLTGSLAPAAEPKDLLGIVPKFVSARSSSLIISPSEVSDYNYTYNFENGSFAITMMVYPQGDSSYASGSIILTKEGPAEDLRTDENGNPYTIPANRRSPYRLSFTQDRRIKFERDTNSEIAAVSSSILGLNQLYHVAAIKSGSMLELWVDGTMVASGSDVSNPPFCSNKANIHIGNSWNKIRPFDGVIDNIKVYNSTLAPSEINLLKETLNVGNGFVGNVFHNHGMMTLTSIPARYMDVINVEARGTHTIWETEISCTIGPGEFTRSNNPTLQEYSPEYNQFVFRSFVTGSSFKPFVTTVGLYDDRHRMVAVAKLNTPIQLPDNTDTTIIIRFDR